MHTWGNDSQAKRADAYSIFRSRLNSSSLACYRGFTCNVAQLPTAVCARRLGFSDARTPASPIVVCITPCCFSVAVGGRMIPPQAPAFGLCQPCLQRPYLCTTTAALLSALLSAPSPGPSTVPTTLTATLGHPLVRGP
jgi:hypothetical protein